MYAILLQLNGKLAFPVKIVCAMKPGAARAMTSYCRIPQAGRWSCTTWKWNQEHNLAEAEGAEESTSGQVNSRQATKAQSPKPASCYSKLWCPCKTLHDDLANDHTRPDRDLQLPAGEFQP